MRLPKIGETIDTNFAIELCQHYQFEEIVSRIKANPAGFKVWKFDGASMLPDKLVAKLIGIDQETFSEVALKHDLKYAYGVSGDKAAKQLADKEFEQDLLDIKMHNVLAKGMFIGVDLFGGEAWGTPYSWGFAKSD